ALSRHSPLLPPRSPPISTLFPYTTLFRSRRVAQFHRTIELAGHCRVGRGHQHDRRHDADRLAVGINLVHEGLLGLRQTIDRNHRSEEHTSELQSPCNLVCRLLLEKKKINI